MKSRSVMQRRWLCLTILVAVAAFLLYLALSASAGCTRAVSVARTSSDATVQSSGLAELTAVDLMAVGMPPSVESQLVDYSGMTVSFNRRARIPNYVVWELTRDEASGEEPRSNRFTSDETVDGCPSVDDYRNSGYDKGHMAPAADMKWSPDAMAESFTLTNICPQSHALNAGSWKRLEEKCRTWAQIDSAIIIVSGPVLTDEITEYIGEGRVAVPKRFFKVILSPFANPPRAIGFVMPNCRVEGGMQACALSVDSVEAITGFDFFQALPDDVESAVESQCRFNYWSTLR